MTDHTRRAFAERVLKTLVTYALGDAVVSSHALASAQSHQARLWSGEINDISAQLRKQTLSVTEWQDRVERVFASVDLPELLTRMDFYRLQRTFDMPDNGANWMNLDFRRVAGMPENLSYTTRLFGMRRGRSIVPHGHHNLVSGHLVIKGDLHVRNFERMRDESDSLVIRPTVDKTVSVRDCSTQSSNRNNVHWFTALSDTAFTFDVIVPDLDPAQPSGMDFIDPLHAEKLGDGSLRARRLRPDDARRMYGGSAHH
jgi:hypothetical protein